MRFSLLFGCFLLLLQWTSCIDEVDVDPGDPKRLLVVEGAISNLSGPHFVKVSRSAKYGSILVDAVEKITNATVWIKDKDGLQVILTEEQDGLYVSPSDFKAEVGNVYTLNIILADGTRYISTPEAVQEKVPIESIIVSTDQPFQFGAEVLVQWNDPPNVKNYYQWELDGVYVLTSRPERYVARGPGGGSLAPKDCCSRCYTSEFNIDEELHLFKDNLTDGDLNLESAGFIPDDGRRFYEKYMVIVKQISLTREAYQFLDLVKQQLSIQGNIFDPPPGTIRGNMINLDAPNENVIGYFIVEATTTDTLFLTPGDFPSPVPVNWLDDDCRTIDFSTTTPPPFWP